MVAYLVWLESSLNKLSNEYFFSYFSDQRANCYEFLKIKDRNCLYTCFLGKFYGKISIVCVVSVSAAYTHVFWVNFLGKFLLFVQFQSRFSVYVTQTHIETLQKLSSNSRMKSGLIIIIMNEIYYGRMWARVTSENYNFFSRLISY